MQYAGTQNAAATTPSRTEVLASTVYIRMQRTWCLDQHVTVRPRALPQLQRPNSLVLQDSMVNSSHHLSKLVDLMRWCPHQVVWQGDHSNEGAT